MDGSVRRCLSLYHRGDEQWATQEGAQNIRRWHLWLGDRRNGTNGAKGGGGGIGGLEAGGVEVKEVKEDDKEDENEDEDEDEDEDEEEGEYSSVILDEEDDDGRVVVEGGLVRGKWMPVNPLGLLAKKVNTLL